jgi:hypothetical protein
MDPPVGHGLARTLARREVALRRRPAATTHRDGQRAVRPPAHGKGPSREVTRPAGSIRRRRLPTGWELGYQGPHR